MKEKVVTIPRSQQPYALDFRNQILELIRAGRTPEDLAKEFEPTSQTIRQGVAQAERDSGSRQDGLTSAEKDELRKLRRENRRLREEREILAKAAAWLHPVVGSLQRYRGSCTNALCR